MCGVLDRNRLKVYATFHNISFHSRVPRNTLDLLIRIVNVPLIAVVLFWVNSLLSKNDFTVSMKDNMFDMNGGSVVLSCQRTEDAQCLTIGYL